MGRSLGQVRPQPGPAATIGSATRTRVGVVGPGPGPTVRIGQGLAASQSSLSSCDAMICYSQGEAVSESPGHLMSVRSDPSPPARETELSESVSGNLNQSRQRTRKLDWERGHHVTDRVPGRWVQLHALSPSPAPRARCRRRQSPSLPVARSDSSSGPPGPARELEA